MYVYLGRSARGSSSLNLTMYLHLSAWYFESVFNLISKPLCQVSLTCMDFKVFWIPAISVSPIKKGNSIQGTF